MFKGKALIFSAPSGSGKSTLVKQLMKVREDLGFSISATSRLPRGQEVHGVDYYFLSYEEFQQKAASGEFVEWEEVYAGTCYGTLKSEVERLWASEKHVVFDIDVIGGKNLKKLFGDDALAIFVKAPSFEILEQRLRGRATDSEEKILERLAKAKLETEEQIHFDTIILNDDLERATSELIEVVANFLDR